MFRRESVKGDVVPRNKPCPPAYRDANARSARNDQRLHQSLDTSVFVVQRSSAMTECHD
jgi:hypothetical protein